MLIYCVNEGCGYYVGHIDQRAGIYVKESMIEESIEKDRQRARKGQHRRQ